MNRQELIDAIKPHLPINIDENEIRSLAERLWVDAGSPSGDGEPYWLEAESNLLELKRKQISNEILNRVLMPVLQNSAGEIQDEARKYTKNAISVLQKELLENQQFVLPEGVRFHKRIGNSDILVVEQQPMVRTILVDTAYHQNKIGASRYNELSFESRKTSQKQFRIALPYVVYYIALNYYQYGSFFIGFRNKPLNALNNELGLCVLPNSHDNGQVCCPFPNHGHKNIVDAVGYLIGTYWQSQFRYCLHHRFPKHPAFDTWEAWEQASKDNPLFVLDLNWSKLDFTMEKLLRRFESSPSAGFQDLSSKFIQATSKILTVKK